MKKILKDNLERIVGAAEVKRQQTGVVEYGWRGQDGVFHVEGIAKLVSISSMGLSREEVDSLKVYECQ